MRVQTSLEFLLIASAIAALSLGVIGVYGKSVMLQAGAMGNVIDYQRSVALVPNYPAYGYNVSYGVAHAVISDRSEKTSYAMSPPVHITNITGMSHCTNFGFYGGALDVQGQCGTYDAWEYRADYGRCPSTAAYCFFSSDTDYGIRNVDSEGTPSYSFSLELRFASGTMRSSISSSRNESPVLMGNRTVGISRVVGVIDEDSHQELTLMENGTLVYLSDKAAYQNYLKWMSDAYSVMKYYNGSAVDADVQSRIQETVSSFIHSSNTLIASKSSISECALGGDDYVCDATQPFRYLIQVDLNRGLVAAEQVAYHSGSTIEIIPG
jgi:hypothetical protein